MNKVLLIAFVAILVLGAVNVYQFMLTRDASPPKPATEPTTLQRFKASGFSATLDITFLLMEAGKEQGFWSSNSLDPEFVTIPGRSVRSPDLKEQVASGIKIGFSTVSDLSLARSSGVPVKMVAGYLGGSPIKIFVSADGPIRTVKDLDGKKIGVESASSGYVNSLNNKFAIKAEPIPVGNLTNMVVALKLGRIAAFQTAQGAPLRLVDSGELRILLRWPDILPNPYVSGLVFATDDLIEQNPDLVKRFVKATLDTARYLRDNPRYVDDLYMGKTNAPKDLADKVVSQIDWTPDGRGTGQDLVAAVGNNFRFSVDIGAIPANNNLKIEDAVDVRFLP
jgi:ABC-type nitrate/sulfonate/bicarbonate transport system substrate-binding protein